MVVSFSVLCGQTKSLICVSAMMSIVKMPVFELLAIENGARNAADSARWLASAKSMSLQPVHSNLKSLAHPCWEKLWTGDSRSIDSQDVYGRMYVVCGRSQACSDLFESFKESSDIRQDPAHDVPLRRRRTLGSFRKSHQILNEKAKSKV